MCENTQKEHPKKWPDDIDESSIQFSVYSTSAKCSYRAVHTPTGIVVTSDVHDSESMAKQQVIALMVEAIRFYRVVDVEKAMIRIVESHQFRTDPISQQTSFCTCQEGCCDGQGNMLEMDIWDHPGHVVEVLVEELRVQGVWPTHYEQRPLYEERARAQKLSKK